MDGDKKQKMNNSTICNLQKHNLKIESSELKFPIEETGKTFHKSDSLLNALLCIGAFFQTAKNQDNNIQFLKKRVKKDTKSFGYNTACIFLARNIILEKRHSIIRIVKWICSIAISILASPYVKQIFGMIWIYLTKQS